MGVSLNNSRGFVSEINVTPFVDVMLVLLIIFMVTAPMMTEGLDVDLPQTEAVEVLPTDADHVVLSITKDGELFIGDYQTSYENLSEQLVATVKNQGKSLFLKADKDVTHGYVVEIMGLIKIAGIDKMGIVAEQPDTGAPPAGNAPGATAPGASASPTGQSGQAAARP